MAAGLTGAVLLAVTTYVARAETALVAVLGARPGALLVSLNAQPAAQLGRLSDETVRAATAAAPLDQRVVNVAMARDARLHGGALTPAWLEALSRLGWRDTVSLQNRLYAAAFPAAHLPARTTCVVAALPVPDFLLEIECVVALD